MKRKICIISVILIIIILTLISLYTGFSQEWVKDEKPLPYDVTVVESPAAAAVPEIPIYTQTPIKTPLPTYTLENNTRTRVSEYVVQGQHDTITIPLYPEISQYQRSLAKEYAVVCSRWENEMTKCTEEETRQYYLKYIDEPTQKRGLDQVVRQIKSRTSNPEDQVRIAVSLVQNIPYTENTSTSNRLQFPYETLYVNYGVCSDKSVLLTYLLRELGYSSAILSFDEENHAAVGIRSRIQYSFQDTGYAFIETTSPAIITDSYHSYANVGKITSRPQVFEMSDGKAFDNLTEEYTDAILYNQERKDALSPLEYRQWEMLIWKYGIRMSNGTTIQENPADKPLCDEDRYCNGECYAACRQGTTWTCTEEGAICIIPYKGG